MEMITAGSITGPDILPYDAAHKAVWHCLEAGDRKGLADALVQVTLHSADPFMLAIAGVALSEFEQQGRAVALAHSCVGRRPDDPRVAAVAQAIEAGDNPFRGLPEASQIPGSQSLALRSSVVMILRGGDTGDMILGFDLLLKRIVPAVDADPCPAYVSGTTIVNLFYPPRQLCIGGGPKFLYPFWINVDLVAPQGGGARLRFSPDTVLPLDDASVEVVYSSHCLEHLDDPTVDRLLSEMRRVVMPAGRLVLKVPDSEQAIAAWQEGDSGYFASSSWGLDSVAWSWPDHGVADTLDSRMAMLFCGYWNAAMSRGGSLAELRSAGAFHGPPRIDTGELQRLVATGSPHELAAELRRKALAEDPAAAFNHQNAWGRSELQALVERHGFSVRTLSAADIVAANHGIRDIGKYRDVSIYLEAMVSRTDTGRTVTARSAVNPSAEIPEANASAWQPADLPALDARRWRSGLVPVHRLLWEYHGEMVRRLSAEEGGSHFLSYGHWQGRVSPDLLPTLEGIFAGEPFLFHPHDCRADGLNSNLRPQEVEDLQRNLRYFAPTAPQQAALNRFLSGLAAEVEAQLQRPWRVLNVRCYETTLTFRTGPQNWHRDGLPSSIVKLLVYLSPDGTAVGSQLIDRDDRHVSVVGESGIWLLFDPNRLLHRGPPEGSDRRRIIEVTLCGDMRTDTTYRYGGTNFRHPLCPPSIDPFQQGLVVETVPLLRELRLTAIGVQEIAGDKGAW